VRLYPFDIRIRERLLADDQHLLTAQLAELGKPRVEAHGIPVGIVPHAGHSMAWENPEGLAQLIASHG
jgi:pimeloyl-ACP methyl ester carboxylesterase